MVPVGPRSVPVIAGFVADQKPVPTDGCAHIPAENRVRGTLVDLETDARARTLSRRALRPGRSRLTGRAGLRRIVLRAGTTLKGSFSAV